MLLARHPFCSEILRRAEPTEFHARHCMEVGLYRGDRAHLLGREKRRSLVAVKGDIPLAALVRELFTYLTQGRWEPQEDRCH